MIEPELNQLIYTAVAFVILLFLLTKFAFPPLVKMMDERQQKIRDSLDEAEQAREEAHRLLEDYKKQLQNAQNEAKVIIEQRKEQADKMKDEIIEKAREQSQLVVDQARQEIENEKNQAIKELQNSIANWSVDIAEKAIKKQLSEAEHKRLFDESISELSKIG